MKKFLFLIALIYLVLNECFGQNGQYSAFVKEANALYKAKDFLNSALKYSEAFKANNWKGTTNDRYNAACSWALAGVPDSSFFQLERIASKSNYSNLNHITNDSDLNSLHQDDRWNPLIELIRQNKVKEEANLDKSLVAVLDSIYITDQKYRQELDAIESKYGHQSAEIMEQWKLIHYYDSINLIKITKILDEKGWLGPDVVGRQGSMTIFLVIQHSHLAVQEKYLPMMREAVKNKKASGSQLALLEDRVALRQGKKQIYGSQISLDEATNKNYILPLEDPDNVDLRRAEVGLPPLAEYVSRWQIVWDPIQYKKDLPAIEAMQKK